MFEFSAEKNTVTLKSIQAEIGHLYDELPIFHSPSSEAPNGTRGASLLGLAAIGAVSGDVSRIVVGVPAPVDALAIETNGTVITRTAKWMSGGLLKGAGLAAADAGADMLLQRTIGHNIMGHDLFRPTGLEMLGMGIAAAAPLDMRVRVGVGALSWLAGRVENFYHA